MAIIKVATYDGKDFENKIFLYSDKWLTLTELGFRPSVEKYGILDKSGDKTILLTVSKSYPSPEAKAPYNCIFHVWSSDPLTAKETLDEFIKKTGFEARPAPEGLEEIFNKLDNVLNATYVKTGTVKLI